MSADEIIEIIESQDEQRLLMIFRELLGFLNEHFADEEFIDVANALLNAYGGVLFASLKNEYVLSTFDGMTAKYRESLAKSLSIAEIDLSLAEIGGSA